jgi:uncharacterized protein with von Willebrand factor type A (vWA) domain
MAEFNAYADHCTLRIRAYLKADGTVGRIDGPAVEKENGLQEMRMRPDNHGAYKLVGVYDITGYYIPYFPYDLKGKDGIEAWLNQLKAVGFEMKQLQ